MSKQDLGSVSWRLISYLIDSIILIIVSFILTYLPFLKSFSTYYMLLLFIHVFYFTFFFGKGATPGMELSGLKLIKENDSKPTYSNGFVRFIGLVISIFFLLLGILSILRDENNQGWHDKLAKTYVIKDN